MRNFIFLDLREFLSYPSNVILKSCIIYFYGQYFTDYSIGLIRMKVGKMGKLLLSN